MFLWLLFFPPLIFDAICFCYLVAVSSSPQLKAEASAPTANGESNKDDSSKDKDKDNSSQAVKVAVLFAGRQASGGHNIIGGLHDFLKGTGSKVRGA